MKIPDHLQNRIRTGLTVRWSGRRAVFEVVEEMSEAIFRSWIVVSAGIMFYDLLPSLRLANLLVVISLACLIVSHRAIIEMLTWASEIYVICSDDDRDGGRVFKFSGWANRRSFSEPITSNSPTIDVERPWYFRLWGAITGEKMERVRLYSSNHTFLEGRKMNPAFYYTLMTVGGYRPTKNTSENLSTQDIDGALKIVQLIQQGALDKNIGKEAIRAIVHRTAFQ
jgi:hypothetical protein